MKSLLIAIAPITLFGVTSAWDWVRFYPQAECKGELGPATLFRDFGCREPEKCYNHYQEIRSVHIADPLCVMYPDYCYEKQLENLFGPVVALYNETECSHRPLFVHVPRDYWRVCITLDEPRYSFNLFYERECPTKPPKQEKPDEYTMPDFVNWDDPDTPVGHIMGEALHGKQLEGLSEAEEHEMRLKWLNGQGPWADDNLDKTG